jgi:hypothetical protein
MFNNVYVENVLTQKSIQEIKDSVDYYSKSLDFTDIGYDKTITDPLKIWIKPLGRLLIQNLPLSDECLDQFKKIVIENNWTDYHYVGSTAYLEYSNKYGNPKLMPHKDTGHGSHTVIIDYCIETNVVWPIFVENESFLLKNNSAVVFDAVNQNHHRPIIKMSDSDFEKVLLVKFAKTEEK